MVFFIPSHIFFLNCSPLSKSSEHYVSPTPCASSSRSVSVSDGAILCVPVALVVQLVRRSGCQFASRPVAHHIQRAGGVLCYVQCYLDGAEGSSTQLLTKFVLGSGDLRAKEFQNIPQVLSLSLSLSLSLLEGAECGTPVLPDSLMDVEPTLRISNRTASKFCKKNTK